MDMDMDIDNDNVKKQISIIMRQTTLTKEECYDKLKQNNYDHIQIIKEYIGIKPASVNKLSSNQERFRLIRNYLDNANKEPTN